MKKLTAITLIAVFSLGLAGCRTDGSMDKQTGGAILGGIAGGLIGSKIGKGRGRNIATFTGAVLGVLAGSAIGAQLDERDRLLMGRSTQKTLERGKTNVASKWVNPDTGNRGTITPRRTYRVQRGSTTRYCREFQQTITVGGKTERAFGRACRQPDGSWKIVN